MSKKTTTAVKKTVTKKVQAEEPATEVVQQKASDTKNILENDNLEELSPEELKKKIENDEQYEEVFTKLNELFLGYSNEMTQLDAKRQKVIDLMKSIHTEFKSKQGILGEDFFDGDEDEDGDLDGDDDAGDAEENAEPEAEPEVTKVSKAKPAAAKKAEPAPTKKAAPATGKKPAAKKVEPVEVKAEEPEADEPEAEEVKAPAKKAVPAAKKAAAPAVKKAAAPVAKKAAAPAAKKAPAKKK